MMKNLLLLLVLANVLYFLWGRFTPETQEPGVAILDEADLGPPLPLAERTLAGGSGIPGVTTAGAAGAGLAAVTGRACVTIGPFREDADAEAAIARWSDEGMQTALRPEDGEYFVGHWVQIRNVGNRAAGRAMLAKLREGGLDDAYLADTEDEGLKVSLGLFSEIERAEKVELQAKSLGLAAEIGPMTGEGTLYFIDVELPPERGAGAIVDAYGEDMVRIRGSASCPRQ